MNNLKTLMRICLAVAIICLLPQRAQATHIVGGNMEYDILSVQNGEMTVRIKLAVYRDCFFGDPTVFFDDPAYIGIFGQDNLLKANMQLDFSGIDDTLNQGLDSFCLVNLQPVCVHTTSYEGTITIPVIDGGYTFAYQRCCRNQTIVNITDPLQTGATFLIRINDAAIARANHSPEFDNFPPVYVCANEPFVFSNTASDLEGDSLVYELCTPFEGGTIGQPQPIPTNPPPYDLVTFANGYSLDNLLGTGDPLSIDPQTGLMTALPMTLGQFVIGVCVREYDRETGELLSINRRDFQYNVNPCENIMAEFEAPEVQCDDLTVLFENLSTSPPLFDWYINGMLFSNTDSAFLEQTFADTGAFDIELIAVPNTVCADTFSQTISLVNNSIEPDFFFAAFNCVDSTILELNDQSIDTISSIDSFRWEVAFNGIVLELEGPNPSITLPSDVSGTITLIVYNENACEQSFTRDFDSTDDNPTDFILAERDVCSGENVQLNPFAPDSLGFSYLWSPAELLDDPTAQNPIATLQDITTTFTVVITNGTEGCETELETTITVLDSPEASYDAVPECGGITYVFNNTSTDADSYFYDFGVAELDSDTSDLASPSYTFPGPGTYTVTFIAINDSGCTDTLIQDIVVAVANQIELMVDDNIMSCEETVTIVPTATSLVTFTYFDAMGNLLGTGDSLVVTVTGMFTVNVIATDADGCTEEQLVTISGGPVDVSAPDTVLACGFDEIVFGLVNNDPNDTLTYVWTPDSIFDPTTLNDAEPVFIGGFGEYAVQVAVTNQFGCAAIFDIVLIVQDEDGALDFEWEPDCSGSSIMFTNTSSVDFGFVWDFGGLGSSNETNPTFTFPGPGVYPVTLSTIYPDDCIASITMEVTVTDVVLLADIDIQNTECSEDGLSLTVVEAVLNVTGDTLIYNWTFEGAVQPTTAIGPGPHDIFVDASGDITITLMVESEDDCMSTFDTTLNIQLAQVDLETEVTICPGDSIALNPNFDAAYTYAWTPSPDFDADEANPVTSVAGAYSVIVSTMDGDINCPAFDTIMIVIADSIEMSLLDTAGNVIPETVDNENNADGTDVLPEVFTCGDPATITAVVEDNIDVIWTDLDGNVLSTENPAMFDPIDRDTVVAGATDEFGCMVFDTLVIVNQMVDAMADPPGATVTVCATQDTFVGVINNDPNDTLTFAWEDNPIIISALDSAYVIIETQNEGTVELNVTVSNQFGCDTVITFMVVVEPFISTPFPDTVNACFDQPTALNPGGVEIDGYVYEWSPMDGDFSNPANPVVTLMADQAYGVTITDPVTGCSESDSILVVVAPDLMFEATSTQDTSLCFPGDVTFMTTHAEGVVVSWYDGLPFSPPPLSVGDDYTVTLTDDGEMITVYAEAVDTVTGCRDTLIFMADLQEFDPGMFPDTVNACFGEATQLNPDGVNNPDYTYEWEPNIGNDGNPTVTLEEDMTYMVTVTDPLTGCELLDTVFVDVSEDINFEGGPQDTSICLPDDITFMTTNDIGADVTWYDDAPLMNEIGTGDDFTLSVSEPGIVTIYALAVDPETGCSDTLDFTVELIEFDPNMYPDTVNACFGEDTQLNPGGVTNPDYTYEWEPNIGDDANPTVNLEEDMTFMVTITDPATACDFVDTIFVSVSEDIGFEATPVDTILCEPGTYTVTASTAIETTITWYDDPELMNEIGSGTTIDVTVADEGTVTIYGLATETEFGCMDTIVLTATLDILDDGLPDENPQGCFGGDPVDLFSGGTNPDYIYTYDPIELVDLSDPDNPIYTGDVSTQITVTTTNPETGCVVETMVNIDITDLTMLTGTADPDTVILGESTDLEVLGCTGDCDYDWMEPNGTIDINGSTATATPDEEGNLVYFVEVNSSVCTEVVEIPVFVIDVLCIEDRVYLPNAFSPNNDGQNDELRLRSTFINQIETFELMIFNRWGQEMYRSFNPLESWDGTFKGDPLEPDVYGFYMRVICPDGDELIQKGNITILR